MKARVYVSLIFILVGLTCFSYFNSQVQSWPGGWVGATAWCWKYSDGHGIAHGSVGWGYMKDGGWNTFATIYSNGAYTTKIKNGNVIGYGGGASHVSGPADSGSSYSTIHGQDHGGDPKTDSNMHSM